MNSTEEKDDVKTPLGPGKVVYTFPDGTIVVEFDHGGGHIFFPEEVFRLCVGVKRDKEGGHGSLRRGSVP